MGKYRFERQDPVSGSRYNVMNFDSSVHGSLNRMFGWKVTELRQTGRKTDQEIYYDVYGRTRESSKQVVLLGKLRERTDQAIWDSMT